jgi:hypothetical protein
MLVYFCKKTHLCCNCLHNTTERYRYPNPFSPSIEVWLCENCKKELLNVREIYDKLLTKGNDHINIWMARN